MKLRNFSNILNCSIIQIFPKRSEKGNLNVNRKFKTLSKFVRNVIRNEFFFRTGPIVKAQNGIPKQYGKAHSISTETEALPNWYSVAEFFLFLLGRNL